MKYQFTMTASPYEVSIYNDSPFEVSIYNDSPFEVLMYNDSPLKHQFTMADINKNSYRHANLFISLQFSFFFTRTACIRYFFNYSLVICCFCVNYFVYNMYKDVKCTCVLFMIYNET